MSTFPPPDPSACSSARTAIGHFFIPPTQAETPPGVDAFVPAVARDHQPEILRIATFIALWSFVATGCFLPWGGENWMLWLRGAACILLWVPVWFFSLVLTIVVPGAFSLLLHRQNILGKSDTRTLSVALSSLIFSFTALILARSTLLPCQIVGMLWLLVLMTEASLRILLLLLKIRR